jgi:tetratricopeptide (TPR) repeat protein
MSMSEPINPQFVRAIAASITHWQRQTTSKDEQTIQSLDKERQNLNRAVNYGLQLAETWQETAVVVLQTFHLAERRGYWQEWISLLQTAAADCPPDNPTLKAELLNRLGELYRADRQLPAAIEAHLQAEKIVEPTDQEHLRHRIWFNLSTDYVVSHQYEVAERYGRQALAGFIANNAPLENQAKTLNTLGMVAWWRGQLDLAEAQLQEAVALWRKAEQPTELLRALNNLMGALKAAKKYEALWPCYEEATACFPLVSGEFEKTLIEVNLGGALFEQERYAEAETMFHRANSIYLQQSPNLYYRALVAQCLGNTLLKQNRLVEAMSYLGESANLWRQSDDNLMLANTLGTMGELYALQGQLAQASTFFAEALDLLTRYPDNAWAKKLLADFSQQRQALSGDGQAAGPQ